MRMNEGETYHSMHHSEHYHNEPVSALPFHYQPSLSMILERPNSLTFPFGSSQNLPQPPFLPSPRERASEPGAFHLENTNSVNLSRVFHQYVKTLPDYSTHSSTEGIPATLSSGPPNSNEPSFNYHSAQENQSSKPFICQWRNCYEAFTTRTGLATHIATHLDVYGLRDSNEELGCHWGDCNEKFKELKQLAKHLSQPDHIGQIPFLPKQKKSIGQVKTQKKRFQCTVEGCNKTFSNASNRKKHEATHDSNRKRYYCTGEGCFKSYSTKTDLKLHLKIHTNEFPHKCSFPKCTKAFVRLSELYAHERSHDNILPHECSICKKRFRERTRLQKHFNLEHANSIQLFDE